jgi:hypothetical protein
MAGPVESAFRRGLGRILTGMALILFGILLASIGLPYSSGAAVGVAAIVIFLIGVTGLVMALTGYGEISEAASSR